MCQFEVSSLIHLTAVVLFVAATGFAHDEAEEKANEENESDDNEARHGDNVFSRWPKRQVYFGVCEAARNTTP